MSGVPDTHADFSEWFGARSLVLGLMIVDCESRHVPTLYDCGCTDAARKALEDYEKILFKIWKDGHG